MKAVVLCILFYTFNHSKVPVQHVESMEMWIGVNVILMFFYNDKK